MSAALHGPGWATAPATGWAAERDGCGTVIVPTSLGSGAAAPITSFNPLLNTALGAHQVLEQFYRPLVWIDAQGRLDPSRGLAQAVDTPDGGLTFVVTLHDWMWSDGVPVTADDVLFTLDLIRRLGSSYAYYGHGGVPTLIARAEASSPHRVTLRMTHRVNPDWFVSLGLGNLLFPLPRHVFGTMSLLEMRRRQTDPALFRVSDSAFVLKEYAVGRHIVLEPNPLYGGTHPHIRRLVLAFPNGTAALEQMRAGELDIANVPFLLTERIARLPGFDVVSRPPNHGYGDGYFNYRSVHAPFLRDPAVRRAIIRGVDQREIIRLVFHGQAQVDHGPVPPAMDSMLSPAARAGYPDLSYDPAAARALLLADGWRPGPDGIMVRDGQRLAFTDMTSAESTPGVLQAQVIQRDLRAIGIDNDIQLVGFNQLLATLDGNGHDWDMATLLWSVQSYPDVHDFFSSDGQLNFGHYLDPRMDALNRDVMFGDGDGSLHAVQDYAAEQAIHLYLPTGTYGVLVRPGIGHVADFLTPNGMWSPELLTLSGPLACSADTTAPPHA